MPEDWTSRFKTATRSSPSGTDWEKTFGGGGPTVAKLGPAYSGMERGYNSSTGALAPKPLTGPTGSGGVNATSRIIPSPSNTNWNSTFNQNSPSSPSGTNWQKTFGQKPSFVSQPKPTPATPRTGGFQFDLAPANTRNQLSLGNDVSSFYKDRIADTDLSSRDHELYGAGNDYGFAF